jgi:hypothetical protein
VRRTHPAAFGAGGRYEPEPAEARGRAAFVFAHGRTAGVVSRVCEQPSPTLVVDLGAGGRRDLPRMEVWAGFVHRVAWHGPLWSWHRPHHRPCTG